ncbi:MAG: hypothetical protein M3Z09_09560 [Acidobacteriota bacterium]|nr:hypothetical protein [Acidobacteriota bacterium]
MRFQVTFRKRFNQEGDGSDSPQVLLNLPDGVIQEGVMVEQIEPDSIHGEDKMDEDDDFLPFGSEVWEYEVTDGREDEFKTALDEMGDVVLEYDEIEEETGG